MTDDYNSDELIFAKANGIENSFDQKKFLVYRDMIINNLSHILSNEMCFSGLIGNGLLSTDSIFEIHIYTNEHNLPKIAALEKYLRGKSYPFIVYDYDVFMYGKCLILEVLYDYDEEQFRKLIHFFKLNGIEVDGFQFHATGIRKRKRLGKNYITELLRI